MDYYRNRPISLKKIFPKIEKIASEITDEIVKNAVHRKKFLGQKAFGDRLYLLGKGKIRKPWRIKTVKVNKVPTKIDIFVTSEKLGPSKGFVLGKEWEGSEENGSNWSQVNIILNGSFGFGYFIDEELEIIGNKLKSSGVVTASNMLKTEVLSTLAHEITHSLDVTGFAIPFNVKKITKEGFKIYVNQRAEVKAFLQQVILEIENDLIDLDIWDYPEHLSGNEILRNIREMSSTWNNIEDSLTEENKRIFLKAVAQKIVQTKEAAAAADLEDRS